MNPRDLIELALAAICLGAGIWLYRRPSPATEGNPDRYGSQGAVLLFVIAAILTVHGLGLLRYHPSATEIEAASQ
ncbi:MAG: hypothetical protein ABIR63_07350 [Sphingomicrobium sp.]